MKKITIITALALLASAGMQAQTAYDAYVFSQNNYGGTARSIAMGNAMTAVGGDLGSLTFNPAGSAVAGYSTITLTPAVSIASAATGFGSPVISGNNYYYSYGSDHTRDYTRLMLPNVGAVLHIDTGNRHGLKSFAIGLVANVTDNYNSDIFTSGYNDMTSIARSAARAANGYQAESAAWPDVALMDNDAYDLLTDRWIAVLGYRSRMTSTYGSDPVTGDPITDQYAGVTEQIVNGVPVIPTDGGSYVLQQQYGSRTRGSKFDMLLNFGGNIDDRFYFGANLGIIGISQRNDMYIREIADVPALFRSTFEIDGREYDASLLDLRYSYTYRATGTGVYGKFGFIWKPVAGLRLGAAVQTPTLTQMEVRDLYSAEVNFDDARLSTPEKDKYSPEEGYSYMLTSPYRVNAGLAYTVGRYGLVSVDYEFCDYRTMRFSTVPDDDFDYTSRNDDIRATFGAAHHLRAGLEVRPTPALSVRAGYNLTTDPVKEDGSYVKSLRHVGSFGIGYSSPGSFFADFACRVSALPQTYVRAYEEWGHYDDAGYWVIDAFAPEIRTSMRLVDVVLTFGWRF